MQNFGRGYQVVNNFGHNDNGVIKVELAGGDRGKNFDFIVYGLVWLGSGVNDANQFIVIFFGFMNHVRVYLAFTGEVKLTFRVVGIRLHDADKIA